MKLYLSSYHLPRESQSLSSLEARNKKVAVIRNALDIYTDVERLKNGLEGELNDIKSIGLEPKPLDLRDFFGKRGRARETHR